MAEVNTLTNREVIGKLTGAADANGAGGPVPVTELPQGDRSEGAPVKGSILSALEKKAEAQNKRRFQLHVALIMEQDDVAKEKALFIAWMEGTAGVTKRLASNG